MKFYHKRMEGKIPPLKSGSVPKRFVFFDTETTVPQKDNDIREFKLILGVLIYVELNKDLTVKRREIYRFKSIHEFIELLDSYNRKKNTLHIFAHNIGFDVRVLNLFHEFNALGYKSEPPIINERAFIWRVRTDNGNYLLLDTSNLGVHSVSGLGKDMGFSKLDINLEEASEEETFIYCQRDVEILERFILEYIRFIGANDLGTFKVTLASQSLTAFRTRFMHKAPVIHNNQEVLNLERQSYHGGRVECFRIGKLPEGEYFYLDVNSMYPYSMLSSELPIELLSTSHRDDIRMLKYRLEKYYLIADCTIQTNEAAFPLLQGGKLIFPVGTYRTVLSHSELLYASERGMIRNLHLTAQYSKNSIFDKYVNFFYDEKVKHTESGNKTLRYITKLFLNSLYGKFGQTQPIRDHIGSVKYDGIVRLPCYSVVDDLHYQEICWFGEVYKEYRKGETSFSLPSLASAITANARMLLWMYIKQAGIENVYYCDTDSLITNRIGFERLSNTINSTAIGSLKLEAQSSSLAIFGNKDYSFGQDSKTKGIPSKAIKIGENAWEYLEFEGMMRYLNRGGKGAPKAAFKVKQRKSAYNKGIVNENGTVIPFTFGV